MSVTETEPVPDKLLNSNAATSVDPVTFKFPPIATFPAGLPTSTSTAHFALSVLVVRG